MHGWHIFVMRSASLDGLGASGIAQQGGAGERGRADLDRSLEFMHFCGSANLKWNGI
jgi:hypothetical protein